ncbi:MAG: hypothetical protein ACLSVD_00515 [Eggerthellaceae bacterium]
MAYAVFGLGMCEPLRAGVPRLVRLPDRRAGYGRRLPGSLTRCPAADADRHVRRHHRGGPRGRVYRAACSKHFEKAGLV